MSKKIKFPENVYVQKDDDATEDYFLCWENPMEAEDGEIAVYKLVETKRKITKTILES